MTAPAPRNPNPAGECYRQQFTVPFQYPVWFTRDLFAPANPILEAVLQSSGDNAPRRILVFVDDGLAAANPAVIGKLKRYLNGRPHLCALAREPESVPGGERTKIGWNVVRHIMSVAGAGHLCRRSFVMAVGGGSVLDMVGFAASLVHRGLRLIRVPTTVLSQCDGGVGVKNGMNEHGVKNFVGTFAPPFAVLVDFDFLATLDRRYWLGGVAEAFKVAIIKDAAFFDELCAAAGRLTVRDPATIASVVKRAAVLHLEHIRQGGDPFELGTARPLDFGHWAAHRLEMLSECRISHGEAVAQGIALDCCYAAAVGLLTTTERDRILHAMKATGLALWSPELEMRQAGSYAILKGLDDFREHLGGELTITLPRGIGAPTDVHQMDRDVIAAGIRFLREYRVSV